MKELRFSQIGTIVRQHIRSFIFVFVLSLLVFLTVFGLLSHRQQSTKPPIAKQTYTAQASLIVYPIYVKRTFDDTNGQHITYSILSFGEEYIGSDQIKEEFINDLDSTDYVNNDVFGSSENNFTNLIKGTSIQVKRDSYKILITVVSPNPKLSMKLANNIVDGYDSKLKEYASIFRKGIAGQQLSQNFTDKILIDDGSVISIQHEQPIDISINDFESIQTVSAINIKMVIVSLMIGFVISLFVVVAKFYFSDEFYDIEELKKVGPPLLGWLSLNINRNNKNHVIPADCLNGIDNPFNQVELAPLASKILHKASSTPSKIIGIVSPSSGEGKSSLSAQLCCYFNRTGGTSLLMQAGNSQAIKPNNSITDVLQGNEKNSVLLKHLHNACASEGMATINIKEEDYSELVNVEKINQVFEILSNEFDYLFVDFPSYFSSAKRAILLEAVDNFVLVIQARKSSVSLTNVLISDLVDRSKNILGIIYNCAVPNLASRESEIYKIWKLNTRRKI